MSVGAVLVLIGTILCFVSLLPGVPFQVLALGAGLIGIGVLVGHTAIH